LSQRTANGKNYWGWYVAVLTCVGDEKKKALDQTGEDAAQR